ncbi:MAG: hypothetical protein EOP22_03945 [Hyphomicrobiales bacterium]|nr:MAG: hypothetical protein EOP22_03945 [Hyphomicrobiales bacterium]
MTTDTASIEVGRPGRAADLDLFKTLLVWGMIAAHCIQLLAFRPKLPAVVVSEVVNLITFSGFMFAFGLGIGLSRGQPKSWWARLKPALLLLVATWVSELAFMLLVERANLTPDLLWNILSLSRLYGWSEFLASFFTLYLIIALARPLLVAIGSAWYFLVPTALLCLASTQLVVSADLPLLATLLGTTNFASFPLLPYLPWFLIGIYCGRHPERPLAVDWVLAVAATGLCTLYLVYYDFTWPGRFPPTALWIIGPALLLLVYLSLSRLTARHIAIPPILLGAGRHVLAALLVSNLVIFGLRYWFGFRLGQWWWTPVLAIGLIVLVTVWAALLDALAARRRARVS